MSCDTGAITDFYRGDTKNILFNITSDVFRGGTAYLTFKTDKDLPDAEASLFKTAMIVENTANPGNDYVLLNMTEADSLSLDVGWYYVGVQFEDSAGANIKTIVNERVRCKQRNREYLS